MAQKNHNQVTRTKAVKPTQKTTASRPGRGTGPGLSAGGKAIAALAPVGTRLIAANLLVLCLVVLLVCSDLFLLWYVEAKKVNVIAVTESGKIQNPVPLNNPLVTQARVVSFSDTCIRQAFSHDFEHYRSTMQAASACFTDSGYKSFLTAFDPLLQTIRTKRIVMSVTTEPPSIVNGPYLLGGRVTWDVQAVVTLLYQGTTERYPSQQRLATLQIVREPIESDPRGIAIDSIQLAPYSPRN